MDFIRYLKSSKFVHGVQMQFIMVPTLYTSIGPSSIKTGKLIEMEKVGGHVGGLHTSNEYDSVLTSCSGCGLVLEVA